MARRRTIKIDVVGDASGAKRAVGDAKGGLDILGGGIKKLIGVAGFAGLTAGLFAAGKASVTMARDFETSMAKIVGLVGVAEDQVEDWKDQILELSGDVAKAPQELADALFFITSAGLRGSEAMDTLEASAKAASAGLGETEEVAFAAVAVLNAYGTENISAAEAVDVLTNTVRQGNVEASEVASTVGKIIPIAAELGVSFDQVGASIAAMTRLGANASESVTNLQGIFTTIIKPSSQAQATLQQYGLSALGLRKQLKEEGLLSVLNTLSGVFANNEEAVTKVFGRVQGLTGFLSLMGKNAETNVGIFNELANSAGTTDEAFAAVAETSGFKLDQAMTELKAILTEVGADALPTIVNIVQDMTPVIAELIPEVAALVTSFLEFADTVMPVVTRLVTIATRAFRGFNFAIDAVGDALGITDGRTADMARSMSFLEDKIARGHDPAAALANALLDMARTGKISKEEFEELAATSGLTDERIQDVAATLIDYAAAGNDSEVSTRELREAMQDYIPGLEEANVATGEYMFALNDGADAQDELSDALDDSVQPLEEVQDEVKTLEDRLNDARDAQESLSDVLKRAADPVFDAVSAFGDYEQALADYDEALADPKTSSKELAELQLDIAEAAIEAQGGLDRLEGDELNDAMRAIGLAIGKTEDEVEELLRELGILDGKEVTSVIRVSAPRNIRIRESTPGNVVIESGGRTFFAKGGIATGPTPAIFGEAGDEAVIPLNDRGVAFMARAIEQAGGVNAGGGGGFGSGVPIQIQVQVDGRTIAEAMVDDMADALNRREDSLR